MKYNKLSVKQVKTVRLYLFTLMCCALKEISSVLILRVSLNFSGKWLK